MTFTFLNDKRVIKNSPVDNMEGESENVFFPVPGVASFAVHILADVLHQTTSKYSGTDKNPYSQCTKNDKPPGAKLKPDKNSNN